MKEIDWETYQKAFEAAEQSKKELLMSTFVYDNAAVLFKIKGISIDAKKVIIPMGNHILGLCTMEELLQEFSSLGIPDSYGFFKELNDLISKSKDSPAADILRQTTLTNPSLAEEIKQTEQSLANAGVHTMAGDMRAAGHAVEMPVHQSSQADILSRPTPPPPPPAPEAPRWESD